jgi:hypothetical protein
MQDLIDRPDPYAGNVALGAREDFRQALLSAWATETVNAPLPTHALVFNGWLASRKEMCTRDMPWVSFFSGQRT